MKFMAPKKRFDKFFFHPCLSLLFLDPGWVKIRIRDKHPGSATLLLNVDVCRAVILNVSSSHEPAWILKHRNQKTNNPINSVKNDDVTSFLG